MHMALNLNVVISYIYYSKTVLGMDCVSINLFYYMYFFYYLFFYLVNYLISGTFLFKWEKRVYDVSKLQAVKLKDFFCKNYLIFLFLFSVDVMSMSYTFFLIHSLNLKCILHPKAAFSAVCLNTYERFSPQQRLKSRSIFSKITEGN